MTKRKAFDNGPKLTKSGTIDKRTRAGRAAAQTGDSTSGIGPGDLRDSGHIEGSPQRYDGIGNATHANSGRPAPGPGTGNGTDPGTGPGRTERAAGFIRNKLRDRPTISDDGAGTGIPNYNPEPKTGDLGGPSASVNPDGKTSAGVKGAMTAGGAERLVVSTFGLIANVRRRPHWAIKNPATEVRPWAADLAEVINSIPIPWVQAAGTLGAGVAVAFGIGSLVVPRAMTDAELNTFLNQYPAEIRGQILADIANGRGVPEPGPYPFASNEPRAETRQPEPSPNGNGKHSGGAQPTSPNGLDGLISENGFAA